ncbi:hypothetical protein CC85DRAFT_152540 [Cutaneotrichosporon oleaginosum]|uniref:Uncharacterized protein n=1 Tax=Cutaneotrichosporon oleaginosum TaxID=879819 RepID=A0A0J0XVT8_9TREE|nr:uncharacterized protein CC85DRAFT_152540 [Cutaneotrichosporon oleaginosum]KLT45210.1 hypothetical protein CC85DRAFT_152540 [Cutaneotrichosporon oleaginosum]TXT14954.1 hypothetical protein COLE_01147 [Cutaneotrichosporon oleaginosum]
MREKKQIGYVALQAVNDDRVTLEVTLVRRQHNQPEKKVKVSAASVQLLRIACEGGSSAAVSETGIATMVGLNAHIPVGVLRQPDKPEIVLYAPRTCADHPAPWVTALALGYRKLDKERELGHPLPQLRPQDRVPTLKADGTKDLDWLVFEEEDGVISPRKITASDLPWPSPAMPGASRSPYRLRSRPRAIGDGPMAAARALETLTVSEGTSAPSTPTPSSRRKYRPQ